jgi:protein involved in polysaccharide export with SLBB domain
MARRPHSRWLLLPLGFAVAGCTSVAQVSGVDQQQIRAESVSPRLQAGEKIRVNVYGESSLSGDYQIDPSGFVSMPLAGNIQAAGLTQNELAQALATSLRSQY